MILQYDGSLCGFLCLLGSAIKERLDIHEIIRGQEPASGFLFASVRQIDADREWAAQVTSGLARKLGNRYLTTLAHALFSEEDEIEEALLALTRRALHEGRGLLNQLADPLVNRIEAATLRTVRERHRLLGLLRFNQLVDDSYLARGKPQTNIVPLLGSHFANRLGDQRWLIVDERRKLGVWGENRRWQLVEEIEIAEDLSFHPNEQQVRHLWRSFYHNISNPDRYNPKLRQQFMPKIYWQYLTELHTDLP